MGNSKSQPPRPSPPYVRKIRATRERADRFPDYNVVTSPRSGFYPHSESLSLDALRFHETHGINVALSHDGRVATRNNSFCYAIAFTSRSVRVEERVRVRLRKVDAGWSGVMRFGFTNKNPALLLPKDLPRYACPDLTNQPGYWAKALPVRFAIEDTILSFYVSTNGCVFYSINNKLEGIILEGLSADRPLWGLFDIYGNTTSLELMSECDAPAVCEESPIDFGLSNKITLPSNMPRIVKRKFNVDVPINPIRFSATFGNGLKCRNHIHATRRDTIVDSTVAFTNTALKAGETVYFYCAEAKRHHVSLVELMGFGIGVTTCDPTSIIIAELPFDSQMLMDRSEYWVYFRDIIPPSEGEYFGFTVEKQGFLSYIKESTGKTTLFHMDVSQPLYFFIDMCSHVSSVAIIGVSSEPDDEPSTSSPVLFDLSGNAPAATLNFFSDNTVLNHNLISDDLPGPSGLRSVPSGIYPHEDTSTPVTSRLARRELNHTGLIVTGTNTPGRETVNNEQIVPPIGLGEEESDSGQEDAFFNAHEIPESSSSSSDSDEDDIYIESIETDDPTNFLNMLEQHVDIESLLQPLQLTRGAVGGQTGSSISTQEVKIETKVETKPKILEKEEKEDEKSSEKECVVCYENPVNSVIYSCGHACMCYECGQVLMKQRNPSCPICRARIKDVIRVFPS